MACRPLFNLNCFINRHVALSKYNAISLVKTIRLSTSTRVSSNPELQNKRCTYFSGIQPTSSSIHLGNYFGAIVRWVQLQQHIVINKSETNGDTLLVCLADLHSITLPSSLPSNGNQLLRRLSDNCVMMAASLLACGIDPRTTILFQQSQVPAHTQLAWVLICLTTMPRLGRLPQYKEKAEKFKVEKPLGLFVYPVLQCADILLYKANHVPVGEDQLQHIQLAQDLAHTFNRMYGDYFPRPTATLGDSSSVRLKSLRDPTKKMSKSDSDDRSRIELADSDDTTFEKIKKAVTDCTSAVTYDLLTRPGVSNLVDIECLLTGKTPDIVCSECIDMETADYKVRLAEVVNESLRPLRLNFERLIKDRDHVASIIRDGNQKANEIANRTWMDVKRLVGFD